MVKIVQSKRTGKFAPAWRADVLPFWYSAQEVTRASKKKIVYSSKERKLSTYNLFISHSWAYSNAYEGLLKLLDNYPSFSYRDYSVPRNDPIHNAPRASDLREAIKRQMQNASVVVVLAGVYSTYSKWIGEEISLAQKGFTYQKPILAIAPWASKSTSTAVKNAADKIVSWNSNSIVSAIEELA